MGDEELPGDVAGAHPHQRQLHDATPHAVRQGASVHENPAQLVHSCLTCGRTCHMVRRLQAVRGDRLKVGSKVSLCSSTDGHFISIYNNNNNNNNFVQLTTTRRRNHSTLQTYAYTNTPAPKREYTLGLYQQTKCNNFQQQFSKNVLQQ